MADLNSILGGNSGMSGDAGGGISLNDIINTYNMLSSLTPLITAAATGAFSSDKPSGPSEMQKLLVQSMQHPGQPITATTAELMNPNILGIKQPRVMNPAVPLASMSAAALPNVLRGLGGLTNILGLGGKAAGAIPGAGAPGAAAPQPVVGVGDVPQVPLGNGVTMDAFPQTLPNDISPSDLNALINSGLLDPSQFGMSTGDVGFSPF